MLKQAKKKAAKAQRISLIVTLAGVALIAAFAVWSAINQNLGPAAVAAMVVCAVVWLVLGLVITAQIKQRRPEWDHLEKKLLAEFGSLDAFEEAYRKGYPVSRGARIVDTWLIDLDSPALVEGRHITNAYFTEMRHNVYYALTVAKTHTFTYVVHGRKREVLMGKDASWNIGGIRKRLQELNPEIRMGK